LVLIALIIALFAWPEFAFAERQATRDALARFEESFRESLDGGTQKRDELLPAIVVEAKPAFVETEQWFPNEVLQILGRILDASGLRYCEACNAARSAIKSEGMEYATAGALSTAELLAIDESMRGGSAPAKTGWWIAETPDGISVRAISLTSGKIIYAQNFDAKLLSTKRSLKNYTIYQDRLRRQRGESLTHSFLDVGTYPNQHFAFDWLEQWGTANQHLTGLSISLFEPILGIGASYGQIFPNQYNAILGGKLLMSLPTAFLNSISKDADNSIGIDPILTAVGIIRVPFPGGNYGVNLFVTSNAKVGIGISAFNSSFIPVLP
jgi:hypothetical protein